MGIYPAGVRNGGGRLSGGGDLHLPPLEHSGTVYCDQDHYGPVPGGVAEAVIEDGQSVVGAGSPVFGGDADSVSVGGTNRGG